MMKDVRSVIPKEQGKCPYTSCYCEENIWKLCELVRDTCSEAELAKCSCVFISNDNRQIPLWHQKASSNEQRLVIWDYHVILIYEGDEGILVYDLDTELNFPCTFKEYADACIGDESILKPQFKRKFRVIPAKEFLSEFASDRSHMLDDKGDWKSEPPNYPSIQTADVQNNIQEFISMDKKYSHGKIYDVDGLLQRFNS